MRLSLLSLLYYLLASTAFSVAASPTFAIRDGDISQYTLPQNDLLTHSCMKHTPHDLKNHFETKSLQNLIHSNSESRASSEMISASPASTNKLLAKPDEIDLPAPVGEEMKGITIPQYDLDGKLKMKLSCEKAHKTDEHNITIHGLKIEFFEKDGKDITVTVSDAIFNLAKTLLSTETTTTIQREDFLMLGDAATFDTTKRFGTMKGHVHTEVRNGAPSN